MSKFKSVNNVRMIPGRQIASRILVKQRMHSFLVTKEVLSFLFKLTDDMKDKINEQYIEATLSPCHSGRLYNCFFRELCLHYNWRFLSSFVRIFGAVLVYGFI